MKTLSLKTNRSRQARRIDPDRAERAVLAQQALARMRVKRAAENGSETPSEREKTVEQLTPKQIVEARQTRRKEAVSWLLATFPQTFKLPRVPLAIHVHRELKKQRPNGISTSAVMMAVAWWCRQPDYIAALAKGGARFGLDGKAVGEISPEHQAVAQQKLELKTATQKSRR